MGLDCLRAPVPNVALVVLDTLRWDAFERAFDWLPGRRFSSAYSTAHWTVPAHASLFNGKYASEVGVHGKSPPLDCPDRTLAEAFQDAGYHTRCLTANPQMVQYDGWERGFDEFVGYQSLGCYEDDVLDWGETIENLEGSSFQRYFQAFSQCVREDVSTIKSLRHGYDLFTRHDVDGGAAETLDRVRATEFEDEEFCFVNLMEAHTPYYPPDDGDPLLVLAAERLAGQDVDVERAKAAYAESVDYLSEKYREIYAELDDHFDYIVTVSDHGELLGEHGLVNHSYGIYPELVHVPMVVDGPDVEEGTDDRVASILDAHRTVADLADVDVDSRGQSLLGEHEPTTYGFEYHGLLPFHPSQFDRMAIPEEKYERWDSPLDGIVAPSGDGVYETHEEGLQPIGDGLADGADRLETFVDSLDRQAVDASADAGSGVVEDRLEALGYA